MGSGNCGDTAENILAHGLPKIGCRETKAALFSLCFKGHGGQ